MNKDDWLAWSIAMNKYNYTLINYSLPLAMRDDPFCLHGANIYVAWWFNHIVGKVTD